MQIRSRWGQEDVSTGLSETEEELHFCTSTRGQWLYHLELSESVVYYVRQNTQKRFHLIAKQWLVTK
jgi:hypothetical protein